MNAVPRLAWWSATGGFIGSLLVPSGASGVLFGTVYGFIFGLVAARLVPAVIEGLRSIASSWVRALLGLAVLLVTWWVNWGLIIGVFFAAGYFRPLEPIGGLHAGAAFGVTFAVAAFIISQSRQVVHDPA